MIFHIFKKKLSKSKFFWNLRFFALLIVLNYTLTINKNNVTISISCDYIQYNLMQDYELNKTYIIRLICNSLKQKSQPEN